MAERLFFALWPGGAERRALAWLAAHLARPGNRPTHPADLHLTLVFLGVVDQRSRRCAERVADAVRAPPFRLCLDRLGYWRRSGIIWLGPGAAPDGLTSLAEQLSSTRPDCGLAPEPRPYRPHITLIRRAAPPSSEEEPAFDRAIDWPVADFVLAAGAGGRVPRYQVLRRWPLEGV